MSTSSRAAGWTVCSSEYPAMWGRVRDLGCVGSVKASTSTQPGRSLLFVYDAGAKPSNMRGRARNLGRASIFFTFPTNISRSPYALGHLSKLTIAASGRLHRQRHPSRATSLPDFPTQSSNSSNGSAHQPATLETLSMRATREKKLKNWSLNIHETAEHIPSSRAAARIEPPCA